MTRMNVALEIGETVAIQVPSLEKGVTILFSSASKSDEEEERKVVSEAFREKNVKGTRLNLKKLHDGKYSTVLTQNPDGTLAVHFRKSCSLIGFDRLASESDKALLDKAYKSLLLSQYDRCDRYLLKYGTEHLNVRYTDILYR